MRRRRKDAEGKRGKYLEKEKMFFVEEKKNEEGKYHGDSPLEREKLLWTGGRTDGSKAQEEVLADLKRSLGKVENPFNHKKDNSSCTL